MGIKTRTGAYSAINRMEKNGLVKKMRIEKISPEIIIKITKKGMDEINIFTGTQTQSKPKNQSQTLPSVPELSQDRIQELTKTLELSQEQVQKLTDSLKSSQDQSLSLKQSLNKSQAQVKKLNESLEILKSQESHGKNKQIKVQKKMKETRELSDDGRADLIQSVGYKIIDAMGKDYEELTQKQADRVENIAKKIVDQIRDD